MVGSDRIGAGERLRVGSPGTYAVVDKFAAGKMSGPARRESSHGGKSGRDGPIPTDAGEGKCIVAVQFGVVHACLTLNCRSKNQREEREQQSIHLTHLSSICCFED